MKPFCVIAAVLCLANANGAHAASARAAFDALNGCLLSKAPSACRGMLTTSSLPLYDRISSYDVLDCLPKENSYVSEQIQGKYTFVRATTQLGNTPRFLKLAFIGGKLDIPHSLKLAIGENWEKQVNAVEAVYLMLKAQLGGKLNCATVQGLAGGEPTPTR
jgi:hypothetical protein